jgi:hypothetical protein
LFSLIFNDPQALRELYSAIEGVPLNPNAEISINTLSDVLYMDLYNDISFTINNELVILIEHQSTINPNMPLRLLFYLSGILEKLIDRRSLYREKLVPIPRPRFIVLYNGSKPYPDHTQLKLSDAYRELSGPPGRPWEELDFTVEVEVVSKSVILKLPPAFLRTAPCAALRNLPFLEVPFQN